MQSHGTVWTYWNSLSVITAVLVVLFASVSRAQTQPEPSNRVVIVVDGSGSYKPRQEEAIDRAVTLLEGLAQTKLHRWEPATDRVTLISLDAIPEVLWQGTLQDLKKMDRAAWTARFRARTDYVYCTDVSAAFQLAAQRLEGDSRFVGKYLFVFSDLIHEPPTTSITTCRRPMLPSLPTEDFPWEALRDVSISVFWMPPDQKLAWRRAVAEHGLEANFLLYTTSESAEVTIAPPPRPTIEVTEAERKAEQERYIGYAKTLAKGVGVIMALVILLAVVGTIIGWLRQRRARSARVPVTGVVRPLPGKPRPLAPRPPAAPGSQRQP